MRNAKSRRGDQILAAAVGAAGVMLLSGAADAAINTYQVGSGYTYTTVQEALNAARTGGGTTDTQIVRIMDSGNYTS